MQSNLFQPLYIRLMPSKLLLCLISCVSIVSCAILLQLPISRIIKLIMIALILASSTYFILRDALLRLPWSWQMLELDTKGQLKIVNQRGEIFRPTLASATFVHTHLVILNCKPTKLWQVLPPLVLFSSDQYVNELRRLRVWLRWFRRDNTNAQDDFSEAA
jgi:hypothetical protein